MKFRATYPLAAMLFFLAACHDSARVRSYDWVQTELFFGLTRLDHTTITEAEWQKFLDEQVTPRFASGLTVFPAEGRYIGSNGQLYREPSRVILLMYPRSEAAAADKKIRTLMQTYIRDYHQDSVLRADAPYNATLLMRPADQ
jgi:hypothetical protein